MALVDVRMPLSLSLPTLHQNWSCHGCGDCCRQHAIYVTDAERQRILDQGWTPDHGAPAGNAAFRKQRGRWRLANTPDGACVFLDEHNRCRIHAKFGEPAKPLACRVYPFALHPAGNAIAVSLRFSCSSVAADVGAPLARQRDDLTTLRDLVVPAGADEIAPPTVAGARQLDWPDTLRIVRRLRAMVTEPGAPLALRLVRALFVADMLGKATYDKIRGNRIDELIDVLATAAPHETGAATLADVPAPSGPGRAQFRLIVAQYARRDTFVTRGLRYRLSMVLAATRMARGAGTTPVMQRALGPVPFDALERPAGDAAIAAADANLRRYFDAKLSGLAFCGRQHYGLGVVDGFRRLSLMYPVVQYLARWHARSNGRGAPELADVRAAMQVADHHFGYSPAMAGASFRQRVNFLVNHGELPRLVAWYGR